MYLWLLVFWLQPHKGQLISETFFVLIQRLCNKNDSKQYCIDILFTVIFIASDITPKNQRNILQISALASKKWSEKNI